MGLISTEVEMTLWGKNIVYYESMGYYIPRRKDSQYRITVPKNTKIQVKIKDLPFGSDVKILVECDGCGEILETDYCNYFDRFYDKKYFCRLCSMNGNKKFESFYDWCIKYNYIDILNRWDYELNDELPSKVCKASGKKYYFKCPLKIHDSEIKNLSTFTYYQKNIMGCNKCNSFGQWGIDNFGEDFLEKYWDYDKNINIDPFLLDKSSNKKVWIKCQNKEYHVYKTMCARFYIGNRCSYCHGYKTHIYNSLGYLLPEILNIWSDKNDYSPYTIKPNSGKYAWFKCPESKHMDYNKIINIANIQNFRCSDCTYERLESFLQEKIKLHLNSLQYLLQHEFKCNLKCVNPTTNRVLPYDNEIVDLNLIIEVHGEQHYKPNHLTIMSAKSHKLSNDEMFEYQQWKDEYKKQYALSQGYFYLEVPYWTDDKDETWKKLIDEKIEEINIINTH